jgi:hypothetical protein
MNEEQVRVCIRRCNGDAPGQLSRLSELEYLADYLRSGGVVYPEDGNLTEEALIWYQVEGLGNLAAACMVAIAYGDLSGLESHA